jgi:hypothetical protein
VLTTSLSLSRSYDVDPAGRKRAPDFYGYIPDGPSRTVVFGCLTLNSALLLLLRSTSAALLLIVDARYFLWYTASDMGLYLAQKIARGDFTYWAAPEGLAGIFFSLLARVIVKIMVDYTGNVQCRGSAELGGLYWTANIFLAVAASFASIKIYYASEIGDVVVEEKTMWSIVALLSGALFVNSGMFFKLMKKKYRGTFVSTETGFQWAQKFFTHGTTDDVKAEVFGCNRNMWRAIEGDMKDWVQTNWEQWEDEQPQWFSEYFKASVDEEWLTPEELRRQKRLGGGQRRRSSAFVGLIGEGGRERRMSATVVPVDCAEEDANPTMIAKEGTSVRNPSAKKATVVPGEGVKEEDKEDEPGVDIIHDIDE